MVALEVAKVLAVVVVAVVAVAAPEAVVVANAAAAVVVVVVKTQTWVVLFSDSGIGQNHGSVRTR